jgi:hypothetical protein
MLEYCDGSTCPLGDDTASTLRDDPGSVLLEGPASVLVSRRRTCPLLPRPTEVCCEDTLASVHSALLFLSAAQYARGQSQRKRVKVGYVDGIRS